MGLATHFLAEMTAVGPIRKNLDLRLDRAQEPLGSGADSAGQWGSVNLAA